ncbi:MAG: hypothetical protein ABEJ24_02080 [Candidatus Magasanikbacteria bacterium]
MHKDLEIQEFFIEGNEQEKSHVLLHITEPTTPEEKREGYFFAVAEVENGTTEQIRHVQKMIDDMESGFYETEDSESSSFESTLEFINKRSHKVLQYEDSTLHCFVCAVKENQVSFAYHGKPQSFLFYNDKKGYQKLDLIEEEEDNKNQLFSAMLEGEIHTGDVLYIGTPNIEKLLSEDRLKSLVANNSVMQAAQHIQKSLTGFKPDLSFGGVLFQLQDEKKSKDKQSTQSTETNYRPTSSTKEEKKLHNKAIVSLGKIISKGAKKIFRFFARTLIAIKDILIGGMILITDKGGQRKTIIRSIKRGFKDKKRNFQQLPILSKVLLVIAILSALTFAGSIGYIKYKETKQAKIQKYKNKVKAIKNKKNKAKSELIYEKEKKALTLLNEAKSMLNNLQQVDTETDMISKSKLRQDIQQQLNEVKKVEKVQSNEFVKLDEKLKNNKLTSLKNKIITFGSSSESMEIINENNKKKQTKEHSVFPNITHGAASKDSNSAIFLTKDKNAVKLSSSLNLSKKEFFAEEKADIADISTYAENLYVLDNNNEQIYKHTPIQDGFAKSTAWIDSETQQKIDLSNANSLAIDGNIYVLKEGGNILKLFKGNKQKFQTKDIVPQLEQPTQIWTNADADYIYILEPKNNRIVVLNKNGKLKHQITSEKWSNPSSMIIREKKNNGYVLDNDKILKFSLNL